MSAAVFALALALGFFASAGATDEYLVNGGFETGTTLAWTGVGGNLEVVAVPHSGNWAGRLSSDGLVQVIEKHQRIYLSGYRTYELSGYVLQDAPSITTSLRIIWFDANDELVGVAQSPLLTVPDSSYRRLTTGPVIPPVGVTRLQAEISVQGVGTYSIIFDDMSLAGDLLPATFTPAPTIPPATPTAAPTAHPTSPPTSMPPPTPTPTPTPKPTPTPIRTPIPTPAEPRVFPRVTNGAFEDLRGDGTPYAWRKIGGTLDSSTRAHAGSRSLSLGSDTTSTKWAYQVVTVRPGAYYLASSYAMQTGSGDAFLRISWYDSNDGSGEAISSDDSTSAISQSSNQFSILQTDPIEVPPSARSASIRLMFRPNKAANATAYFDDASFAEVLAPTERPASPTPTPTAPPTTEPSPGVSVTPPATSSRTATPQPTLPPTQGPTPRPVTPTPVSEPASFTSLTNGGFETAREDGTPYAWHKIGGEIAVTDEQRIEGGLALSLSSDSTSTKWAYQAVKVEPSAYYFAEAWAMNTAPGDVLLLRISWYASDDGDGSAIDSVDSSASVTGAASGFRPLSITSARAPANTHSARIRLLLQPATADATRAFLDDVRFSRAGAPAVSNPRGGSASSQDSGATAPEDAPSGASVPTALGSQATPAGIVHVTAVPAAAAAATDDGSSFPWPELLIAVPVVGIAAFAAEEAVRRKLRAAQAGESTDSGPPPRSEH